MSIRYPLRNDLERVHCYANERDYVRVAESFQQKDQIDEPLQHPRISMSGEDMQYQTRISFTSLSSPTRPLKDMI